ncbi:MAG: glycosyltransferase family 52 protein [Lachnospiraceae bacterium]|nr:glycosyltransferase family 52 protein [Lachnospiraceae bacterium]
MVEKTKKRIYVCHTFYHVLVTFLKELSLPVEEQGKATLVLSKMSNDFGALKEQIEKTGYFEDVLWFDEKRETFFPALDKYKKNRGNIVINMFYRIRFVRKFAKLQAPYVPVDFREYENIYVFCDSDPIGIYLNMNHIYYHAMEDGLDCLKTLDSARVGNIGHFELKEKFARKNLIFMENGHSKYCIDMEVNNRSVIKYDFEKYVEVPRAPLYERLTPEDKDLLLRAFVANKEEIETSIGLMKAGRESVLILSDPLCDLETRKRIMDDLLATYGKAKDGSDAIVFIKPHPRDVLDYKANYPNLPQFDAKVPMGLLSFVEGIHCTKVVSVFTELSAITYAEEKIRLGGEFMDQYEDPMIHNYNERI